MDIFIIFLIFLTLWGFRPTKNNNNYLGKETTTSIKGIFAILILYSHGIGYPPPLQIPDNYIFTNTIYYLLQLIVVMFLVYSGYGIIESYKKKQSTYLNGFMRKRVLKTLIHFDIAVIGFVILALILGKDYSLSDYVISLTGWKSIGNSNWFIFDIIILYLISYIGLLIIERFKWNLKIYLLIVFAASLFFIVLLSKVKDFYWYDTIIAFPTGMLWSIYKKPIEIKLKNQFIYIIVTLITLFIFIFTYSQHYTHLFFALSSTMTFGILIILITMRCHLGNKIIYWLGVNAFSIYILQRIPMIIATEYGLHYNPILFFIVVIPASLLIAWLFTKMTDKFDHKFFS